MYLSDAPTNLPACRLQHQVMKLRAEGWLEISVDFFLGEQKINQAGCWRYAVLVFLYPPGN